MHVRFVAFLLLLAFTLPVAFARDAQGAPADPQFGRRRNEGMPPPPDVNDKAHIKARNEERQNQLKADTQKLLEMATELKQYVDKTNESVLSVEVIRKAEAIEKLAKSVREKMKGN